MRQFTRFKQAHPGCLLLFRIGDFYETFDDDAVTISKALGLTLTKRTEGVPMAGVPHHQLENYLRRLIQQGFRVAVCDQIQNASEVKAGAIIERAVTRVLSPGTLVDESLLEESSPGTLAAVTRCPVSSGAAAQTSEPLIAVALVEASTGAFSVLTCAERELADEFTRRGVNEALYADQEAGLIAGGGPPAYLARAASALGIATTPRPTWQFRHAEARDALLKQFRVASLEGFGLDAAAPEITPAGAIVRYLLETQAPHTSQGSEPAHADAPSGWGEEPNARRVSIGARPALAHLRPPRRESTNHGCVLDAVSLRALEVERTLRAASSSGSGAVSDGSLVGVFIGPGASSGGSGGGWGWGGGKTAMGKRLLRDWLCRPSGDLAVIRTRHSRVAAFVEDRRLAGELAQSLACVQDIARIATRIALARATPRDLVALGQSLAAAPALEHALASVPAFAALLAPLAADRKPLADLAKSIMGACVDSPPPHLREGGLIRAGVDAELDEARTLQTDAATWLADYQERLSQRHQLPGMKVGYNRVFGYYIELPAGQARRAPDEFTRKQTLKNAERYITPELKDFEEKVSTAEARALERERALFDDLCLRAAGQIPAIAAFASIAAECDALLCFADRAIRRGWVRPEMVDAPILDIRGGRHPVLEASLGDRFVPNDLTLGAAAPDASPSHDAGAASLALITGPNMAGKSTFIRQAALIVLLAHAGSFVPAASATIGLTDRIFTRVGADDALHAGQSTFMVEMTETANILHHATPRSLVILDEIGRGTSTLDGLALAWAIAEHLAEPNELHEDNPSSADAPGPRTLFATHYHELTRLDELAPGRVKNLHVAVREWPPGDPEAQLVFLHQIEPGRADRSYGVQVARLAGVPTLVVQRARAVLESLTLSHEGPGSTPAPPSAHTTFATHDTQASARRIAGANGSRRAAEPAQLALFKEYLPHPALDAMRELKIDALSPLQAFDALRRLHALLQAPEAPARD